MTGVLCLSIAKLFGSTYAPTKALLKTNELTDDEIQAIGKMLDQLSKKLLDAGKDGKP